MIYSHIHNGIALFARANDAVQARLIFVRSIRGKMREAMEAMKEGIQRDLMQCAIETLRVSTKDVFEYCENHDGPMVGIASLYDQACYRKVEKADSFTALRAYQKPSRKDWAYDRKTAAVVANRNSFALDINSDEFMTF